MPDKKKLDAVELLEKDHRTVEGLFKKFEKAKDEAEKEEIADQVDLELRIHSMIEEEILYPALKDIDSEIVAESFEEHGVVEELLDELATMEMGDEQFQAKFKVMQENVAHHIEEEEKQMFPKCSKIPNYEELGAQLAERKRELAEEFETMGGGAEERVIGAEPATIRATEKAESVLEGAKAPAAPEPAKTASGDKPRSRRAAAGSRSRGK